MNDMVGNTIFEIGCLMENRVEEERSQSIGHHVYEISLILSEYKEATINLKEEND